MKWELIDTALADDKEVILIEFGLYFPLIEWFKKYETPFSNYKTFSLHFPTCFTCNYNPNSLSLDLRLFGFGIYFSVNVRKNGSEY